MGKKYMKLRLSVLMFLQVGVFGVVMPVMSLYLIKTLGFSQNQAGAVLSIAGITTVISPIIGMLIADKLMGVERILGLCHFFAAGFMFLLSFQTSFGRVLLVYLLYMLVLGATSGFASSIVFQHDPNPKKNFGFIRMWGSLGWVVPGWFFSYIWLNNVSEGLMIERLADILIVASVASFLVAIYTLTLPKSKVVLDVKKGLLPLDALKLLKDKQVFVVLASLFVVHVSYQFYSFGMAPFLEQSGYSVANIMPIMSLAQIVEIVALALLGFLLVKLSYKKVIMMGVGFNIIRYAALAGGTSIPLVLTGVIGQGFSYALFFNAASVYLDSKCDATTRSDMQQIIVIVSSGLGVFLGNLLAGIFAQQFANAATGQIQYSGFWLIPIAINILVVIGLGVLFKEEKRV